VNGVIVKMNRKNNEFIFSMASSYSGHTLISLFLNAHPKIADLGDTLYKGDKYANPVMCKCGLEADRCQFWMKLAEWSGFDRISKGMENGWQKKLFRRPELSRLHKIYTKYNTNLISQAQLFLEYRDLVNRLCGTDLYVHGKKRTEDLMLLLSAGVKVRLIHTTRHPYRYVESVIKRGGGDNIGQIAYRWLRTNKEILGALKHNNVIGYCHVSYEEFCYEQECVLKKLCRFVGVEYTTEMLNPELQTHHLIGANSIVKGKVKEVRLPDSNNVALTKNQQDEIWKVVGSVATGFGYAYSI